MTTKISVLTRKETAWRAAAEQRYADRRTAGMIDHTQHAGTPGRAWELQARVDATSGDADANKRAPARHRMAMRAMRDGWRAAAEKQYADREAAGWIDNAGDAGSRERAWELQRLADEASEAAWSEDDDTSVATQNAKTEPAISVTTRKPKGKQTISVPPQNAETEPVISVTTRKRGRPPLSDFGPMSSARRSSKARIRREVNQNAALHMIWMVSQGIRHLDAYAADRLDDALKRLWHPKP